MMLVSLPAEGTVEVDEEEQSQMDEARKTDYRKSVNESDYELQGFDNCC